jgi:hypothetical protein
MYFGHFPADLPSSISHSSTSAYQHGVGHRSTASHKMMRSASFVAGDTQQSPTFTVGERSVITGDSVSVSGSEDEEEAIGDEAGTNGSKKRKRSHVKISYV